MRDLLPPEAHFQSHVGRDISQALGLFGYERVWLPMFEYAEVLERSQPLEGTALRFIEPESGEVVALRSDMTPQIARVVATRYREAPKPVRLSYQGSVVRRRKERARTESQVVQAGAELVGKAGVEGDFEVIEVLCAAVRATRLDYFVLDIGHAGIATELLSEVVGSAKKELWEALDAKDVAALGRLGKDAGIDRRTLDALCALPELHGGAEVWAAAHERLQGTRAAAPALQLETLFRRAVEARLAPSVVVDLGETRNMGYYTGAVFHVLADGPGEPVASGGRYDSLYQRFGLASPAAGFAIDLNHLCWALRTSNAAPTPATRIVVSEAAPPQLAQRLREAGYSCAVASEAQAYARFWQYDFVVDDGLLVSAIASGRRSALPAEPEDAVAQIAEFIAHAKA